MSKSEHNGTLQQEEPLQKNQKGFPSKNC